MDFEFIELPPELQAALDHHRMHSEQSAHDSRDFLESLDEEQLRILRGMIRVIDLNESAGSYYAGIVSAILSQKFHVCLGCGKKHDEELKDMAGEGKTDDATSWADFVRSLDNETLTELKTYGVQPVTGEWPQVRCENCGRLYPSLEDRKLNKPDECGGCQQIAKWG